MSNRLLKFRETFLFHGVSERKNIYMGISGSNRESRHLRFSQDGETLERIKIGNEVCYSMNDPAFVRFPSSFLNTGVVLFREAHLLTGILSIPSRNASVASIRRRAIRR